MEMLTKRQAEILRVMRDEEEELVYENARGMVGDSMMVAPSTVFALIRLMALRMDPYSKVGDFERYTINETGRKLLEAFDEGLGGGTPDGRG